MRLSIIIPTFDEEAALRDLLPRVLRLADEVVVSDGGSTDGTVEIARSCGARVVRGASGRGAQLNRGAGAAQADVLLFLHADTRLPAEATRLVRQAVAGGAVGGAFTMAFDDDRPSLRLWARVINLRSRLSGCPLGDQAQFVTRTAFAALEGFRDWPILEDLDFVRRLKRHGRTALIPRPVVTSARRYLRRGFARTVAINGAILTLYFLGVSPSRLARLYRPLLR